jgi:hypothetical protein
MFQLNCFGINPVVLKIIVQKRNSVLKCFVGDVSPTLKKKRWSVAPRFQCTLLSVSVSLSMSQWTIKTDLCQGDNFPTFRKPVLQLLFIEFLNHHNTLGESQMNKILAAGLGPYSLSPRNFVTTQIYCLATLYHIVHWLPNKRLAWLRGFRK